MNSEECRITGFKAGAIEPAKLSRRPVRLVFSKRFRNRSTASREEAQIKKLKRREKLELIGK